MNIIDKYKLCGKRRGEHKAASLHCPVGVKSRIGYTQYHNKNTYTPEKITTEQTHYEVGDEISPDELRVGMKIRSSPYGEFYITKTGVRGDLWTSEYHEDVRTGMGRGLRYAYVDEIKIGPKWYAVEWDRDGEFYKVIGQGGKDKQETISRDTSRRMMDESKIEKISNLIMERSTSPFQRVISEEHGHGPVHSYDISVKTYEELKNNLVSTNNSLPKRRMISGLHGV